MLIKGRLAVAIAVACSLLFALARTGVLPYCAQASQALGEAPRIEFPAAGISQAERKQFLDGDFKIVRDMKALPPPIINAFTEERGSRLVMANPGKPFEATDFIRDPSVPRERLIFAGVLKTKCFLHYEQGGYRHSYIIAFFNVDTGMKPIWRGYCTMPAANISELRSRVVNGNCR
jgi:hypothetical protein